MEKMLIILSHWESGNVTQATTMMNRETILNIFNSWNSYTYWDDQSRSRYLTVKCPPARIYVASRNKTLYNVQYCCIYSSTHKKETIETAQCSSFVWSRSPSFPFMPFRNLIILSWSLLSVSLVLCDHNDVNESPLSRLAVRASLENIQL